MEEIDVATTFVVVMVAVGVLGMLGRVVLGRRERFGRVIHSGVVSHVGFSSNDGLINVSRGSSKEILYLKDGSAWDVKDIRKFRKSRGTDVEIVQGSDYRFARLVNQ